MRNTKAIINFSSLKAADLGPVAQNVHDQMAAHAALFVSPPVAMDALQACIDTFHSKLAARASRATVDVLAVKLARGDLETALRELGAYVNSIAKGDPAIVEKSGFSSYMTGQSALGAVPGAPLDLRLRHGEISGEIVARYLPDRRPSMNEVQKCTGDPGVEAHWQHAGIFSGGKATLKEITPGQIYWVRVRTCGTRGALGAWSDPAQIRGL